MPEKQSKTATAIELGNRQREISVSEFFLKNRHLLGFDTPSKALVTAVKEAVDNALDACEEAGILPDICVEVHRRSGHFRIVVEDNGPGIVERQIARIFGKLLYGSKFHKLSQSRGQQGMGISAAGMYGQLTMGKPLHILSRIQGEELASELYVSIDTANNRPDIHKKRRISWDRPHGTRIEMAMEGHLQKGPHSVDVYLKQTAIANPHVNILYRDPGGYEQQFLRSTNALPRRPVETKPHPYGIELGRLIQMLSNTDSPNLFRFLVDEFSCVGKKTARLIIENAGKSLSERSYPTHIAHAQATALHRALQKTKMRTPKTDCIVPIGETQLLKGLRKELAADFYYVTTRPAASYRGNPFQVEIGIAYGCGGESSDAVDASEHTRKADKHKNNTAKYLIARRNEPVRLMRFANRVPLLFQQSSCAITKAVLQTNWRTYGLTQPKGALPIAPMSILAHVASVWVPYTSESKEAIEPYPEILREIKLGLKECSRHLAAHLRREKRLHEEWDRRTHIENYLPHIGTALQDILHLTDSERNTIVGQLGDVLQKCRAHRKIIP